MIGPPTFVLAAVLLLPTLPAPATAQDPIREITAEIARLEGLVSAQGADEDGNPQIFVPASTLIQQARGALQENRLLLSLRYLQEAQFDLAAEDFRLARKSVEAGGLAAFEEEWKQAGKEFDSLTRQARSLLAQPMPASGRALAEASFHRAQPYYTSSLFYGRQTSAGSGLFYLGRAFAGLEFARFCANLRTWGQKQARDKPHIETHLAKLEQDVLQVYRPPKAQTHHRLFIRVNSTIKLARELNQDGFAWGALQEYLQARFYFGQIDDLPVSPERMQQLRKLSETFAVRLQSKALDHSVGQLFWEMGQTALDQAQGREGEAEINNSDFKTAAVILESVLPSYFSILEEPQP